MISQMSVWILKLCVLCVIAVAGTLGNIVIILTVLSEKSLNMPGNYFIVNLAAADTIVTAFGIPIIISNLIAENTDNVEDSISCQLTAYLKTIALHVSWYSLALIALNRYYIICRMNEYKLHFKRRNIGITVLLIWLWVITINIPTMVGWAIPSGVDISGNTTEGYYPLYPKLLPPVIYDQSSHDCVLGINGHGGYTYGNGLFVMAIPLLVIFLCYTLVYFAIVQSTMNVKSAMNEESVKKRQAKERRLSFTLLVVVLVFLISWLPVIVYDYRVDIVNNDSNEVDNARLVVNWLALSNSGVNVLLYGLLSRSFRRGYKRLFIRGYLICLRLCCGCCEPGKEIIYKQSRRARRAVGSSGLSLPSSVLNINNNASTGDLYYLGPNLQVTKLVSRDDVQSYIPY